VILRNPVSFGHILARRVESARDRVRDVAPHQIHKVGGYARAEAGDRVGMEDV
jgi:hypothetical protein